MHGDDPRYLPACVEWSGATAYFRPMAHFERYYVLGDVLGLCDNGVVRRRAAPTISILTDPGQSRQRRQ